MADNDESRGGFGSWVNNGQLLITLLTAAFSLYLSVQQNIIKKEQEKLSVAQQEIKTEQDKLALAVSFKAETEKFVTQTLSYMGSDSKLTIPNLKQKEAIIIDLLDAIALANVSQQGKTDSQKILHTPLWIALATGNVEALGLIGNTDNRRDVWIDLANASGDASVRTTAMTALAQSSASDPLKHLMDIFKLSENLNNSDILGSAIEQINHVVGVMEHNSDPAQFRENDKIKPLIFRLEALQTSLALAASDVMPGVDKNTAKARRLTLQKQAQGVERALEFLRGSEIVIMAPTQPAPEPTAPAMPTISAPETITQERATIPKDVKTLIEGLKSTDTNTRRESRQELANNINNSTATDELLSALSADKTNYRVRLGVASALYQAKNPVVIANPIHVKAFVALIGDDDKLIRKYASEALMKLTDAETVKRIHGELNNIIDNRKSESPDAVYNAVVVLGTWMRILPSDSQNERTVIEKGLRDLKKLLGKDSWWKNTSALIDEMLRLSSDTRKVVAPAED